jgi:hypothetical protein
VCVCVCVRVFYAGCFARCYEGGLSMLRRIYIYIYVTKYREITNDVSDSYP